MGGSLSVVVEIQWETALYWQDLVWRHVAGLATKLLGSNQAVEWNGN